MVQPLRRQGSRRGGSTLVELLVVIVIIGLLVVLLLPAIQAARESARRAACQNNLKQIGVALAQHEAAQRSFPVGAAHDKSAGLGMSWWVSLLPFIEEAELYHRLDRQGPFSGDALLNPRNGQLVDGLMLATMICPSTPLSTMRGVGSHQVMMPSYVGISGATSHDGFPENRVNVCCVPVPNGEISAGGVLVPNAAVTLRSILDGTSKTLVVGEASDYMFLSSGVAFRIDGGFPTGWIKGTSVAGVPPNYPVPYPAWNITTIRYTVNERRYALPGINQDRGANNPLVSAHLGGVNVLMADGSVQYLTDGTDVQILKQLATRDDGQMLPEFP